MNKAGSVIFEIQKRPFLRPLIFWIAGIILQVCFPFQKVSFVLLFIAVVALVFSFIIPSQRNDTFFYRYRWVWGILFTLIVVFLAIQTTHLTEQRLNAPQQSTFLLSKAQEMQARMVGKLDLLHLPDEDKAVLATLALNYRKAMTSGIRKRFSVTGVSHLLAVSGFHVGIVSAFIGVLLSFLSQRKASTRWIKFLITLCCVWIFTYLSGLATAAIRAAVMITIYMTGRVLVRNTDRYNTLACAAFCMLVYNPFYLFDIGFQLSFTAVFFILYLQPPLSRLIEIRNPLIANPWGVLTVTMAAQTGTTFLCFYYFGQSSMVFLFTNLALSLLATLLIPLTLVWMIAPSSLPGIDVIRILIETMTRGFMSVVDRFASIPGATLSLRFDFFTLVCSYICLAFIFLYFRSRCYWMLIASLLTLLSIICWQMI